MPCGLETVFKLYLVKQKCWMLIAHNKKYFCTSSSLFCFSIFDCPPWFSFLADEYTEPLQLAPNTGSYAGNSRDLIKRQKRQAYNTNSKEKLLQFEHYWYRANGATLGKFAGCEAFAPGEGGTTAIVFSSSEGWKPWLKTCVSYRTLH